MFRSYHPLAIQYIILKLIIILNRSHVACIDRINKICCGGRQHICQFEYNTPHRDKFYKTTLHMTKMYCYPIVCCIFFQTVYREHRSQVIFWMVRNPELQGRMSEIFTRTLLQK
jgi:hypothetical protein